MILLDQIALRLRARSVRWLAAAVVFEIAGSSAIVCLWPAGWLLGLILVMTGLLRVYSLAERGRESAVGPVLTLYAIVRWLAALTVLAAVALLLVAAFGAVLGSGWV